MSKSLVPQGAKLLVLSGLLFLAAATACHDTTLITPPASTGGRPALQLAPGGCTTVSADTTPWASVAFSGAHNGQFEAVVQATPLAYPVDAAVAASAGPQTAYAGLAAIVRFNSSGTIDAINGTTYQADHALSYAANTTYVIRFVVNVATHQYSAYVTVAGGVEQPLASNYAFRSTQAQVTSLDTHTFFADIQSMNACHAGDGLIVSVSRAGWRSLSLPGGAEVGTFSAEWNATPSNVGIDGVMGLSNGAQSAFANFGVLVRFDTTGAISARDGSVYRANQVLTYDADRSYHFRLVVDVPAHRYDAYVTPAGGMEQTLALGYAFRTEQQQVTQLDHFGIVVDTGLGSIVINGLQATGQAADIYNQTILADLPVAFWNVGAQATTEPDLTGNGNTGSYVAGVPRIVLMPNGDPAADFNGSTQYFTVPSNPSFSVPTTDSLSVEAWIYMDTLENPIHHDDGYVNFMGKCESYRPTCEWSLRKYNATTADPTRCNRISGYIFSDTAKLGSAADWQPGPCEVIQARQWYHVVAEYTTKYQPSNCADTLTYPGSIEIWVNGVKWNHARHGQTGCMSQYQVIPKANGSALNIGTMARDYWFTGAVAKVAIYNHFLSPAQIATHFSTMSGRQVTGHCDVTCSFSP